MRALVVDDDKMYRVLISTTLTDWGYEVVAVESGSDALEHLAREDAPRLVLLDWMMPGISGTELCRQLRENPGEHYTYLLLLSAKKWKEEIEEGLAAGADDYLSKPFREAELRARLRAAEHVLDVHEKLFETRREMQLKGTKDRTTQIWNREAILGKLDGEGARTDRGNSILAAALLDVDRFKAINSHLGYRAGDRVLYEMAQRIGNALRPGDLFGRLGGDEFLAVFTVNSAEEAGGMGERMRAAAANTSGLTASVGVATVGPSEQVEAESLLQAAEGALERAKCGGGNRVASVVISAEPRAAATAAPGGCVDSHP